MSREGGVLLVDKPAGPTSAEIVDWARWALRPSTRRGEQPAVGHCGTLDPAATGLLVVCVGAATKLASVLTDADKAYAATFVLGRSTTTADAEGETVAEADVSGDAIERAAIELAAMTGELSLAPPSFSAVKIEGKRAHELAREGEVVALAPRSMIVRSVDAIAVEGASVSAELVVSKGTYVRSLAEELGRRLGVPAHLGALRRLAAADLRVDDPRALAGFDVTPRDRNRSGKPRHRIRLRGVELDRAGQAGAIEAALVDPIEVVPLPKLVLPDDDVGRACTRKLLNGQPIDASELPDVPTHEGTIAVLAEHKRLLVLATWTGAVLRTTRVVLSP
jgi:tRNA pseudouridine55 synthase